MKLPAIAVAVFVGLSVASVAFAQDAAAPGSAGQGQGVVGGTGSEHEHGMTGMMGNPSSVPQGQNMTGGPNSASPDQGMMGGPGNMAEMMNMMRQMTRMMENCNRMMESAAQNPASPKQPPTAQTRQASSRFPTPRN
jgi:hypothetical protein